MLPFSKDPYRQFIFYRSYSRWRDDLGRRENWEEVVDRYVDFMKENLGDKLSEEEYNEIHEAIYNHEVMPSMRLIWGAGKPVRQNNAIAYNCSYLAPTKWQDFAEILFLLTCGCGVGFSCEEKVVSQLPEIKPRVSKEIKTENGLIAYGKWHEYTIPDSREGWADSLAFGLSKWAKGEDVIFDYSQIRPKGARLKTMGGRASGPEPLKKLHEFARETMLKAEGRKLTSLEVHDIICKIGEIVVAGGVRRSSEISLSDLDNKEMREAKSGAFWKENPHRSMANNSAVYEEKPSKDVFLEEWQSLVESGSGERGIFNRGALKHQMPMRRYGNMSEEDLALTGTNPCGEITLRSKQFCNLSEAIVRKDDTLPTLARKVRLASILGTFQASLTQFPYLSKEWKENCDEERLLGVSLTGQMDNPDFWDNAEDIEELKRVAIETNKEYAERFGIKQSASVTCVKPSGTVSQLTNTASGIHPRFFEYYVKNVRISAQDPLFHMLKDLGMEWHPEVGQSKEDCTTAVIPFPIKSPDGAVVQKDVSALDQLAHWKQMKQHWTEHNPSCTVTVDDSEWDDVAEWVWNNWELVGGLSFLPKNDNVYELAPYEEITKEKYQEMLDKMPEIDFTVLTKYEKEDLTTGASELGCTSSKCELDPELLASAA